MTIKVGDKVKVTDVREGTVTYVSDFDGRIQLDGEEDNDRRIVYHPSRVGGRTQNPHKWTRTVEVTKTALDWRLGDVAHYPGLDQHRYLRKNSHGQLEWQCKDGIRRAGITDLVVDEEYVPIIKNGKVVNR